MRKKHLIVIIFFKKNDFFNRKNYNKRALTFTPLCFCENLFCGKTLITYFWVGKTYITFYIGLTSNIIWRGNQNSSYLHFKSSFSFE